MNKKERLESKKKILEQNQLEIVLEIASDEEFEEDGKEIISNDEKPVKTSKDRHKSEEGKTENRSDVEKEETKQNSKELIESDLETDSEYENEEEMEDIKGEDELSDSDDDDIPEGLSLKEAKERAQQMIKQTQDAHKSIKNQQKKILQNRQLKNRQQQQNKTSIAVPTTEQASEEDTKVDKIIDSILDEVDKPKIVITTQPKAKNQKIVFDDEEDEEEFYDKDIEMEEQPLPQIKAQHLYSVDKIKDIGSEARAFLQEHFFGKRLQREKITKSKYTKRSKRKKDMGRRKKI